MSQHFINGAMRDSIAEGRIEMIDPSDASVFGFIAAGGAKDVDAAVKAARATFDTGAWGRLDATQRGRMLARYAQLIERDAEVLTTLEMKDTGKPRKGAAADVAAAVRYFEYYGTAADKLHGETLNLANGFFGAVVREPFGVTAHILPWNYPIQMFSRSLAPSLAAGNAVILKPAEDASASTMHLAQLAAEAGFPEGALNVVTGTGAIAGDALARHPGVDFISFTGSPQVGTLIQKAAAEHYIGCTLELGGKSPQIVFSDADFEQAAPTIVRGIVHHAGQTCSAGSRVLVQQSCYDEFVSVLGKYFAAVKVGAPEMDLDSGPIISGKQKQRVVGFIDRARASGVPIIAEGTLAEGISPDGFFVRPTLFGQVSRANELAYEEVFGPVLAVLPFEDEADAIRLANATEYGLVAGLWTKDGGRQHRMAKQLRCGQVFINCFGAGTGVELPFGGVGKSGHGREKGFAALHEFTQSKTLVFNHG
jgi:aldehyde dehydrogenase (NAD+)